MHCADCQRLIEAYNRALEMYERFSGSWRQALDGGNRERIDAAEADLKFARDCCKVVRLAFGDHVAGHSAHAGATNLLPNVEPV